MTTGAQCVSSPQIRKILLATDFSDCAESTISTAAAIARRFRSAIYILHVLPHERRLLRQKTSPAIGDQCEEALDRLRSVSQAEPLKDLLCHLIAEPGKVADVTVSVLERLGIDLIILGTHGRRGLQHLVVGSSAQEIMRRADCAVMTIGPHISGGGIATGAINAILYATDFSPGSLLALEYANYLARANGARIIAFHSIAVPSPSIDALMDMDEENRRVLNQLRELMPHDIVHEVAVSHGSAADGILDLAHRRRADLIVMGAHAGSSASAHLPWATAHQVVCEAECPVLTIRAPRRRQAEAA